MTETQCNLATPDSSHTLGRAALKIVAPIRVWMPELLTIMMGSAEELQELSLRNAGADQLTRFYWFEYKSVFIYLFHLCSVTELDMKPEQNPCESHHLYIKIELFLCEEEKCLEVPAFERKFRTNQSFRCKKKRTKQTTKLNIC